MPVHDDHVLPGDRSQGPGTTEEQSLRLDYPPRSLDGLIQRIDHPESGLELRVEHCFSILRQRPDDPQTLQPDVPSHNHVELGTHGLGRVSGDLHPRRRHAEHQRWRPDPTIGALAKQRTCARARWIQGFLRWCCHRSSEYRAMCPPAKGLSAMAWAAAPDTVPATSALRTTTDACSGVSRSSAPHPGSTGAEPGRLAAEAP